MVLNTGGEIMHAYGKSNRFNIMLINVGNLDNVVYVMYRYGH